MRKFYTSALVRGLLWQLIGWIVGRGIRHSDPFADGSADLRNFLLYRTGLGLRRACWVCFGFLGGSGIVSDWFKWARGEETPEHHEDPDGWEKYFNVSLDHKVIGIQYTVTSLFLAGGGRILCPDLSHRAGVPGPPIPDIAMVQHASCPCTASS